MCARLIAVDFFNQEKIREKKTFSIYFRVGGLSPMVVVVERDFPPGQLAERLIERSGRPAGITRGMK